MTEPASTPRHYTRCFEAVPATLSAALARAAEAWGATFTPDGTARGRLELPVNAGLRQGRLDGTVSWSAQGEATQLRFDIFREDYQLPGTTVGLLVSGVLGAVSVLFWPFFPGLIKIAPFGALIAVAVWFLVPAKARYVGAEVFFDRVADELAAPKENAAGMSPGA